MIPRLIHLWWHTIDLPAEVADTRDQWQQMHPSWQVTLWTTPGAAGSEGIIIDRALQTARGNENRIVGNDHVRHHANHVRWRLLHDLGGVWVDTDTEPLEPLDSLLDIDTPFCGRITRPEATVIGGPARHGLFDALIHASSGIGPAGRAPQVSGSLILMRCSNQYPELRILEPGAFFDIDAHGKAVDPPRNTPRFTRHRWNTSSQWVARG
jgi:Glycosyltransferase sugar-binding region containing DXD motif